MSWAIFYFPIMSPIETYSLQQKAEGRRLCVDKRAKTEEKEL